MSRARRLLALPAALIALVAGGRGRTAEPAPHSSPRATHDGTELIGSTPPAWEVREWIGSPPLSLAGLRGKVVLVRWFTSPDCPYCHASAPALNGFHRDYARRGLVVVGMYHHKSDEPLTLGAVRGWVHEYGFEFPVGVDRDWRTLRRWWLDGTHRDFTSVSFLIDRRGVIRHIHPGGTLAPGAPDFLAMQSKIEQLLAE
jgi:peroxiredoxin